MASVNKTSSIGMALAGKTASVDIPKPRDGGYPAGRDTFAADAAQAAIHQGMLPTPPHSISPNLPAHAFYRGPHPPTSPPTVPLQVDSDIDLQDAVHHQDSHHQPQPVLNAEALDSLGDLGIAGAITPAMLAKHHLPNILLFNGPLAIRHIMGYLTTSVPGFSRIARAKARRLVVAALEGRGSGGEGAGPRGDVVFEKVGWGRWDARQRGQPSRDRHRTTLSPAYSQAGFPIPGQQDVFQESCEKRATHQAEPAGFFSRPEMEDGENEDVIMHEAEKMSMDGDDFSYASSSPAPDDANLDDDDDASDATDEEDWASIGAEALRARSLPPSGAPLPRHLYQAVPIPYDSKVSACSRSRGGRTPSTFARSGPNPGLPAQNFMSAAFTSGVGGTQEREAIQALLSLGSM